MFLRALVLGISLGIKAWTLVLSPPIPPFLVDFARFAVPPEAPALPWNKALKIWLFLAIEIF